MVRFLLTLAVLSVMLCSCFDLDPLDVDQLVTQEAESASGDLYYTFFESYITSTSVQ